MSRRLSAGLVQWAETCLPDDPIYRDPLNEIFSVHLREQFDMIERLRLLLAESRPGRVELEGKPAIRYFSPERPNEERGFRESHVRLFLAGEVAREAGIPVSQRGSWSPGLSLMVRGLLFRAYKALRLLQKARRAGAASAVAPERADALFLVRGAAAARNAIPIVEQLAREGLSCRVIHDDLIHQDAGLAILKSAGLNPVATGRHRGTWGALRAITVATLKRPRRKRWEMRSNDPTLELLRQVGAFEEMSRRVADTDFQETWFAAEFRAEIRDCQARVILSNSIFDQWGVLSARLAHEAGLKYVLMHKVLYSPIRYPHIGWCDAFCVANRAFADRMREVGWPVSCIRATGMPGLTPEPGPQDPQALGDGICVTTQPVAQGENVILIRAAAKASATHGLPVCLKLHPREPKDRYVALAQDLKSEFPSAKITIYQTEPLEEVYAKSQILLSRSSTTVLTALIYGLPILALRSMTINTYGLDFLEHPATEVVEDADSLERQLETWITDRDARLQKFRSDRADYLAQVSATEFKVPPLEAIAEVVEEHLA